MKEQPCLARSWLSENCGAAHTYNNLCTWLNNVAFFRALHCALCFCVLFIIVPSTGDLGVFLFNRLHLTSILFSPCVSVIVGVSFY